MKPRGKQRSVLVILFLSLITLGIYFFYWYNVNINELDGYFDFTESDTKPKDVKIFLLIYIIVTLIISIMVRYNFSQQFVDNKVSDKMMMFMYLVSGTVSAFLNYKFLRLIEISYEDSKLEDINLNLIFGIYIGSLSASFFSFTSNSPSLFLTSGILAIVYLVMVQGKINLLWRTI
jgi:low temperature requirement protein LtrA